MEVPVPNWIDVVVLLALSVAVVLGLGQGLLRQLMTVVALYVSTTLSLQYSGVVGSTLLDLAPQLSAAASNGLAILTLFVITFSVLNWLSYAIYPSTRLGSFEWFDRLTGAALASGWTVALLAVAIAVVSYALTGFYSAWEQPRQEFEGLLAESQLYRPLVAALPMVLRFVSPWLPYGLPVPFFS